MTTPYAISTNIGSMSYNNYVHSRITGPLSTNQTPPQIPFHNEGILYGLRPTPPQFYPSQEPVYAEMNTNARHQYKRTTNHQSQPQFTGKMVQPMSSSLHINTLKSNAIGKSAYKINLPNDVPIGTKSYVPSGTRSAIRRVRSGGCVAPAKKGSIYNIYH
jgi:hypothetical protein